MYVLNEVVRPDDLESVCFLALQADEAVKLRCFTDDFQLVGCSSILTWQRPKYQNTGEHDLITGCCLKSDVSSNNVNALTLTQASRLRGSSQLH